MSGSPVWVVVPMAIDPYCDHMPGQSGCGSHFSRPSWEVGRVTTTSLA